jgi:hypothetical protein
MTGAATVAEPAKTAPRAAAAPPVGQWKKRGKNPARHARKRLSTEEADGGQFFMNIGFE